MFLIFYSKEKCFCHILKPTSINKKNGKDPFDLFHFSLALWLIEKVSGDEATSTKMRDRIIDIAKNERPKDRILFVVPRGAGLALLFPSLPSAQTARLFDRKDIRTPPHTNNLIQTIWYKEFD